MLCFYHVAGLWLFFWKGFFLWHALTRWFMQLQVRCLLSGRVRRTWKWRQRWSPWISRELPLFNYCYAQILISKWNLYWWNKRPSKWRMCMMTLPQKRSEKQELSNKAIFDWESKGISLVLLYFVLWLVQKTRASLLTDQMQNYNQSLLDCPRFPTL